MIIVIIIFIVVVVIVVLRPFYLWEQLRAPIIPIVIYGAFDLYPPGCYCCYCYYGYLLFKKKLLLLLLFFFCYQGRQMAIPGKVIVRFLNPIFFNEVVIFIIIF